jgi:hypothetical protein
MGVWCVVYSVVAGVTCRPTDFFAILLFVVLPVGEIIASISLAYFIANPIPVCYCSSRHLASETLTGVLLPIVML